MSLEERRAERRRRRQMEEDGSSVATVNGEDDLERRRRERREARLRESIDYTSTNDSSQWSHQRGREDNTEETPKVNETPSVPNTSEEDATAERHHRQREEEEEEARQKLEREEAEERKKQAQLEQRRREEEEDRRREEERIQQEEGEKFEVERQEQERGREEEEARMAAEEAQKKKRGKRKGLGGLTPEKKKLLKQIIMQKAAEDLKKEALAKAEEKEKYINERVDRITTDGLGEAELRKLCKKLHDNLAQLHSEAYDWEFKVGKQEQEVTELTMKVNDSKGKFVKPVLRKVNKTEQKFAKLAKNIPEHKEDFRETLKSSHDEEVKVGEKQNNHMTTEDNPQASKSPDWRDVLKKTADDT